MKRITDLGFNCVRVAYSLEAHVRLMFIWDCYDECLFLGSFDFPWYTVKKMVTDGFWIWLEWFIWVDLCRVSDENWTSLGQTKPKLRQESDSGRAVCQSQQANIEVIESSWFLWFLRQQLCFSRYFDVVLWFIHVIKPRVIPHIFLMFFCYSWCLQYVFTIPNSKVRV